MPTFEETEAGYRNLWAKAVVIREGDTQVMVNKILENRERYEEVETETAVPWFWVACIHYRESSLDFIGVLHNGERIIGTGRRTTLVPAGRGPFSTWSESATDAIRYKRLDSITEWPVERCLFEFERYNGWGYLGRINSPYVWAGTSLQQQGKYVRDGVFDATHWDTQLGTAAVLKTLAKVDDEVRQRLTDSTAPIPGDEHADPDEPRTELSQFTDREIAHELIDRGVPFSFQINGEPK